MTDRAHNAQGWRYYDRHCITDANSDIVDSGKSRTQPTLEEYSLGMAGTPRPNFHACQFLKRVCLDWAQAAPAVLSEFLPPSVEDVIFDFVDHYSDIGTTMLGATHQLFPKLRSVQFRHRWYSLLKSWKAIVCHLRSCEVKTGHVFRLCPSVYKEGHLPKGKAMTQSTILLGFAGGCVEPGTFYMLLNSGCPCKLTLDEITEYGESTAWQDGLFCLERGKGPVCHLDFHEVATDPTAFSYHQYEGHIADHDLRDEVFKRYFVARNRAGQR